MSESTGTEERTVQVAESNAETSSPSPAPEADNAQAQERATAPATPQKPLWRRLTALGMSFVAGAGAGAGVNEARHQGSGADPADKPPAAVAAPAPGFQENTLPGAQVAAGSADLSLSAEAIKALGKEQKLTELREKYGMTHEKSARLNSGAMVRVMSDADIFATGSDEEFKASMDTLFNAPYTVLDKMPDSPYKDALLQTKGKADKVLLTGREVVFVIPSDPKKTFVDPNDPFGSTEGMSAEDLAQRSPTGLLLGDKGPSPILIFALNAGSADGTTVTRTLNGNEHTVPVAQFVASQAAHELVHWGTRAAGIPFDDKFDQQEEFADKIQASLLENSGSLPSLFKFSTE